MKKVIVLIMLAALMAVGMAQDKYGAIRTGFTSLTAPLKFTAADSLAGRGGSFIVASDSLVIFVTNLQKYLQHQTVTTTVVKHSGTPSVVITLRGRTTSTDNWHPIGTPVTWTSATQNPVTITSTVPINYNYLKVSYVASGTTQSTQVTAFEVRTANVYDIGKVTAMVLGDGSGTIAINSSDWDISATGVQTGMGAITTNGLITGTLGATLTGAAVNLNASSNFAVNIGTGTTTSTVTIGGTEAQSVAIGNGAAAKTVALGSSNSTSTTTLLSGSGGLLLNVSNNQPTNIGTGTSTGLVTIGGGGGTAAISTTAWGITNAGVATLGTVNGLTIANGIGRLVTTATAVTDSTAAGAKLAAVDQFVAVTSGGATRTITLPAAGSTTIGLTIEGYVGANGFDLRVAGAQALTVKINDVTGADAKGVEAAIPATTRFRVLCVSATEWNLTATDELGAVITAIVPATIQKR
jgi:hypothetical protein